MTEGKKSSIRWFMVGWVMVSAIMALLILKVIIGIDSTH